MDEVTEATINSIARTMILTHGDVAADYAAERVASLESCGDAQLLGTWRLVCDCIEETMLVCRTERSESIRVIAEAAIDPATPQPAPRDHDAFPDLEDGHVHSPLDRSPAFTPRAFDQAS